MTTHRALLAVVSALLAAPFAHARGEPCEPQWIPGYVGVSRSFAERMEIEGEHLIFGDAWAYTACATPDPFECSGGAVFAYRWVDGQWAHIQTIVPPDLAFNDGFARDVHIEGDVMMVASYKSGGQVYVYAFNHDLGQWIETDRISPPPGSDEPFFGAPLAFDGGLAILVQLSDHASPLLHRYVLGDEQWEYRDTFVGPTDPVGGFGKVVEISEDWIVVGASSDSTFEQFHGSIYIYRRNPDNTFEFFQKLLPPDLDGGDAINLYFGGDFSFDGLTLAVGSTRSDRDFDGQGVVYVYAFDGTQWTLQQELPHSEPREFGGFGRGVSIDGDTLVAGTERRSDRVTYVFRRGSDDRWHEVAALRLARVEANEFGYINVVQDDRLVVGAPGEYILDPSFRQYGSAYSFDLDCEICTPDLDADGVLTIFDFLTFFNAFDAGDATADFDGDGELTIFDFLSYQTAFDAGC